MCSAAGKAFAGFQRAEPSQALPRQIPPFVTYGDIFPGAGEVFPQRESQAVTFVAKVLGYNEEAFGNALGSPFGRAGKALGFD